MPTVKTAISVEQDLMAKVQELACTMNISRSRVFALAAEDFVRRQENRKLLEKIDAAYEGEPDPEDQIRLKASQRSFRKLVEGEW